MIKQPLDKVQPKGIVERRLIDTRKLYIHAQEHGVKFESSFNLMLAEYKSSTFRAITLRMAKELGNELTAKLIDSSLKSQFADNRFWRFIKKNFNKDIQIPFITGFYTKNAIIRVNLVVNTGHKRYADQIGGTAITPMTALAIGTSGTAPAATDTILGGEITTNGGARAAATISNVTTTISGDTEEWTHTWTVSGSLAVQEEGIFDNNTSGGTMLAHNTFTTVNLVSGDSFQVIHKIQS